MTTNPLFNWLFGPHILGIIFLILGVIQQYYPPKKINNWYGYRTTISQSSQRAWDEANRYSANYMIKLGIVVIILGIITTTLLHFIPMPVKVWNGLTIFSVMLGGIMPPLFMIVATEKHLQKQFYLSGTSTMPRRTLRMAPALHTKCNLLNICHP